MAAAGGLAVRGTIIDAPIVGEVRVREDALVVVDGSGSIAEVVERHERGYFDQIDSSAAAGRLVGLGDGQYLLPGMVDLHIHAPQWPQLGKALEYRSANG